MSADESALALEEVVSDIVGDISDETNVLHPTPDIVSYLVSALTNVSGPPTVRIIAEEQVLKTIRDEFLTSTRAVDLIAAGNLQLRAQGGFPGNTLFVSSETVTGILTAGNASIAVNSDDRVFVTQAHEHFTQQWEDGAEFDLRTPPLSEIKQTLRENFGEDMESNFTEALSMVEERDGEFDIVGLCLLLAAKNHALLYDVGKWGEDVGLASKATFSRTKTSLEDQGYIGTEKVPIEVGRPRMRLTLAGEFSEQPGIADLVDVLA